MKKYSALIMSGLMTTIIFYIGLVYYGFMYAIFFMILGCLLSVLIGNLLLKNPFSLMLEGKGILGIDINSTGVLRPFIVAVQTPYIKGRVGGDNVNDVFDRTATAQISVPKKAKNSVEFNDKGGINISLDEEEYNDSRFRMFHFPCIIWNSQIKSVVTKNWLSENEKTTFAEHSILYLNRKVEELSKHIRDFARHIVDTTKPEKSFLQNKWVWIIVVILGIILVALFAPSVINTISSTMSSASGAVSTAGGAVTPI